MKLLFIDTETTNVDRTKCGIYQIAGAIYEQADAKADAKFLTKFNFTMCPPDTELWDDECIASGKVDRPTIKSYEPSAIVFGKFVQLLGKYVKKFDKQDKFLLVAYNADFDMSKLRNWFTENNDKYFGSWIFSNPICVMSMMSFLTRFERHKFPNFKLGTLCKVFNIDLQNAHDAMSDVIATIGLFELMTDIFIDVELWYEDEINATE